jgi:hypothetical protein
MRRSGCRQLDARLLIADLLEPVDDLAVETLLKLGTLERTAAVSSGH